MQASGIPADGGAEVLSLIADDPRAVARALMPFAPGAAGKPDASSDETPSTSTGKAGPIRLDIDPAQLRILQGCGIHLIGVPEAQLDGVRDTALSGTHAGIRASLALASGPTWVELAREPGDSEPRTIAIHDSRLRLRPGFLRLLARCWVEPTLAASTDPTGGQEHARFGSVLHLELAIQHADFTGADPWSRTMNGPRPRELFDQGQVFTRLTTSVRLPPGQALAIVYEDPAVDWQSLATQSDPPPPLGASPPGDAAPSDESRVPRLGEVRQGDRDDAASSPTPPTTDQPVPTSRPEGDVAAGPGAGPSLFRTPTLGETLLTSGIPGDRGGRVLLIVIPRVRDDYSLLGR